MEKYCVVIGKADEGWYSHMQESSAVIGLFSNNS